MKLKSSQKQFFAGLQFYRFSAFSSTFCCLREFNGKRNFVSLNRNQRAFNNNFCFCLPEKFCHAEAVVIW